MADTSAPRGRRSRVGSDLWRGDVRRLLRTNIGAERGRLWLVTITAPGRDVLPQQGDLVEERVAALWNRTAQRRWSQLWRRAQQQARRAGHPSPLVAGVWQMQRRGVLHLHLVLRYDTPAERAASRLIVQRLRRDRSRWHFGFVDARDLGQHATVMPAERAAGYLVNDLTDERGQLLRAAAVRDRPRRLVYVRRELLALTRCTMRRLRRVRQLYAYLERDAAWFRWMNDPLEHIRVSMLLRGTAPARAP